MKEKLKKAVPYIVAFSGGVTVGLALATTVVGAKIVSKFQALRAKAGV